MQNSLPLVSIIIPAYNQAQYLCHSVESALAQTYEQREIIVVDDGSTDETSRVAGAFGSQITVIKQENRGLAGARNTGIRAAHGEWIGLLDADDIWLPNYLERMMALASTYPKAGVLYCKARSMDMDGHDLHQLLGFKAPGRGNLYLGLLQANFLIPSTVTIRRSTIVESGYFDQSCSPCEDWDLWLRLLPECEFAGLEDTLVRYRVHAQSLSANVSGMHAAKKAVVEKHFGPDDGLYDHWSAEKKLAYGGLYRSFLITSLQRRNDWQSASANLQKTLLIDPTYATDVDLFYELALGSQPVGYRDSTEKITLEANAVAIKQLLEEVFRNRELSAQHDLKAIVYGTACYAIGLCAYNTGNLDLCRRYLWLAGKYRPWLWFSSRLPGIIVKAMMGDRILTSLRRLMRK